MMCVWDDDVMCVCVMMMCVWDDDDEEEEEEGDDDDDDDDAFSFSPLRIMFAVGLSYMAFIMLR